VGITAADGVEGAGAADIAGSCAGTKGFAVFAGEADMDGSRCRKK
jgi:hypothetical protein